MIIDFTRSSCALKPLILQHCFNMYYSILLSSLNNLDDGDAWFSGFWYDTDEQLLFVKIYLQVLYFLFYVYLQFNLVEKVWSALLVKITTAAWFELFLLKLHRVVCRTAEEVRGHITERLQTVTMSVFVHLSCWCFNRW